MIVLLTLLWLCCLSIFFILLTFHTYLFSRHLVGRIRGRIIYIEKDWFTAPVREVGRGALVERLTDWMCPGFEPSWSFVNLSDKYPCFHPLSVTRRSHQWRTRQVIVGSSKCVGVNFAQGHALCAPSHVISITPSNTRSWGNAILLLGQSCRRCPTLTQHWLNV